MATEQLLVRISDDVARRLRRAVPARQRSRFIEDLLEQALPAEGDDDRDPLYLAALAVEQDDALAAEMAEWEIATIDDGFPNSEHDSSTG
jgi:predicted transcriptional regulator